MQDLLTPSMVKSFLKAETIHIFSANIKYIFHAERPTTNNVSYFEFSFQFTSSLSLLFNEVFKSLLFMMILLNFHLEP